MAKASPGIRFNEHMEGGRPDRLRPCLQARDFFASPTASECYGTERARGLRVPEVNWRMTAVGLGCVETRWKRKECTVLGALASGVLHLLRSDYALIAPISGWMPIMLITRVRL